MKGKFNGECPDGIEFLIFPKKKNYYRFLFKQYYESLADEAGRFLLVVIKHILKI